MKKILALFFSLSAWFLHAQDMDRPKLMVGIVVDQMRFDYLERYYDKYGDGGFKRLLQQGFSFKNTHYNYVPTETAPGHSSIYTGATPSVHGIIGNSWYDRILNRNVENIEDPTVTLVGTEQPSTRGASPRNLRSETLTDQLKWGSNYQSKVISVSFKERGAILPGGHTPDGAYWLDTQTSPGYFVSSTYYMEQLPDWVTKFNQAGRGIPTWMKPGIPSIPSTRIRKVLRMTIIMKAYCKARPAQHFPMILKACGRNIKTLAMNTSCSGSRPGAIRC